MTDAVFISDTSGRFVEFNQAFAVFHRFRNKDECSRTFADYPGILDVFFADGTPAPLDMWAVPRALRGETATNAEYMLRRKDTGETWFGSYSFSPIRDKDGAIVGSVVVGRDVTDRKQAEEEVRRGQAVIEAFFAASPGILNIEDDEFRYIKTDRLTPTYFGMTRESIVGKKVADLAPDFIREFGPMMRQVIVTGEPRTNVEVKSPVPARSGEMAYWLASYFPVPLERGRRGIGIVGVDVTELKRAERAVRQLNSELETRVRERTAQLEAANKELEAFAYSVSHDLRAPLRGIDGWSLALVEDYAHQLEPRAIEYLDRVRSETQRMGHLIDDLLQLSRITRAQMHRDAVDLSRAAESVAARLREAHPQRQLEFSIQPGLTAFGDSRLLEIALTNLLHNAVKFTGPRAQARIEFEIVEREGATAFRVRDNGVGFDMAYAGTLFGAFQRLHNDSEFPGTGIGLATVQRVIHRHGGRVWAEAEPGRGASFYFTLDGGRSDDGEK